jgi:23S rRNA (adenine2503-C2)-methyltransferase
MLIYDLDFPSLENKLREWNEPAYRAKQIWQGLYVHLYSSAEQFTNLSKTLREKIAEHFSFSNFKVRTYLDSSDKSTRKTLFELPDGNLIEAVLMRYGDPADEVRDAKSVKRKNQNYDLRFTNYESGFDTSSASHQTTQPPKQRRTLCISTQAGCAMGCVFCATGQMGYKRNLSSGEIVAQVMYYAQMLKEQNESVTNIVFMGMGEPFHNYDNSMAAIDRLNDSNGFNFGARRFTVSTVGLVPQIKKFADEQRQVNLAISLHAADDDERLAIMPVNKRYKIDDVIQACKYYIEKTNRRVTFEWALIHGVNDTPEVAAKLASRLKGLLCHVNAIPLNPTQGYQGEATSRERADLFKKTLENAGIPCTIRMRRGIDINAGCGQLAGAELS